MSYADFQRQYEIEGEKEYQRYVAKSPQALMELVRRREFGGQYTLWQAIAAKVPLALAGWPLYEIVTSQLDYLIRYHAAGALLSLLGARDMEQADLSVESPQLQDNINLVRIALENRVGPQAAHRS